MKPVTPRTEPPPSTQLGKAVGEGCWKKACFLRLAIACALALTSSFAADKDPIPGLLGQVAEASLRRDLFHIAKDPLPFRKANYTVPGHTLNSLDETDAWIEKQLRGQGYKMEREECEVQAFGCDLKKHPQHGRHRGKSDADTATGRKTNVTLYTTPEGKRLADLMAEVNETYKIGLVQSAHQRKQPGDDDGSFIKAGYACAVLNIGSFPYADPNYHEAGDTAERVDIVNVRMATQATLAAVLRLDRAP